MGVAGSKDDRGVRVLQALPPGFLDEKGMELRNNLDYCLEKNGWYFTIGEVSLIMQASTGQTQHTRTSSSLQGPGRAYLCMAMQPC